MAVHYRVIAKIIDGSQLNGLLLEDSNWNIKKFSVDEVFALIKQGLVDNAYKRGREIKIRGQAEHLIPVYDSNMVWRPCNLVTIIGERVIDGQKLFEVMFINMQRYLHTEENVVQYAYNGYMFSNAKVVDGHIIPRYGKFFEYTGKD